MSAKIEPALRVALESLAIPAPATLPDDMAARELLYPAALADTFVSTGAARSLFQTWNPDQHRPHQEGRFMRAFRDFLRHGAALGLRIDRFRGVSATLLDLEPGTGWNTPFEDVVERIGAGAIRLHLSTRAYEDYQRERTPDRRDNRTWREMLATMTDGLFYELGIVFPPIEVRRDDAIGENDFRVEWNDLVLPTQSGLDDGRALVNDTVDRLTLLNIKAEEAVNPANGSECATIPADSADVCKNAGLTVWEPGAYAVLAISSVLRRNAAAFVTRALVDVYLLQLEAFDTELVKLVEKNVDRDTLVSVLRGLVAEEISIRNLPRILQFCLQHEGTFYLDQNRFITFDVANGVFERNASDVTDTRTLVDSARANMKRMISHKYTRGGNTLVVYLLDREFESRLQQPAALMEFERELLLSAVRDEVGTLPATAQSPVILTTMGLRHRMRELVRSEFPQLSVLSYQELSPDMNIQPIARISAEGRCEPRIVLLLEELDRRLKDCARSPVPGELGHPNAGALVNHIVAITERTNTALDRHRPHTRASLRGQRAFVQELLCAAAEAEVGSDHRMRAWKDLVAAVARDAATSGELRALLSRIAGALEGARRMRPDPEEEGVSSVRRVIWETTAALPEPTSPSNVPVDLVIDKLPEEQRFMALSNEELGEDLSVVAGLVDDLAEVQRPTLIDPATVSRAWRKAASLVAEGKSDPRLVASLELVAALDPKFPSLGLILALANWFVGNRSAALAYLQVQLARSDQVHGNESRVLLRRWGQSELIVV